MWDGIGVIKNLIIGLVSWAGWTTISRALHHSKCSLAQKHILGNQFICIKPIPHFTAHAVKHLTPGYPEIAAPCGTRGDKRLWFHNTGKSALLIAMENQKDDSQRWNRYIHYTCLESFPNLYAAVHGTWASFSAYTLYCSRRLIFRACSIVWTSSLFPQLKKKKKRFQ